ncbi:hypothetical protein [Nitratifractor sp.]|uniref:hypothetical protein n=1 Tax=Nitratifractor sp. TaxID=2268144 RepID=UPI0025E50710|nr:hypothetical protein [Nitratifractor sp.]
MDRLNKIERWKAECSPADFLAKIEEVDWRAPSEADRFYLKNYGIYNIKLRPERWMLRLRVDGGRIEAGRLRSVGEISRRERLRPLLTARGQIELHDIAPERILPLWRECHKLGLVSWQTLTDNFRALVTDPLADCAPDALVDTFPLLELIRERFLARPEWLGTLPRKFNTALVGRQTPSFNPWGNDLLFAPAEKEGRIGFKLYLGGKNNETARESGIFSPPEEVPSLFEAVATAYRAHGPRGSRSKTRLFHLIESAGMDRLRGWIAEAYGREPETGGRLLMRSSVHNRDRLLPIRRFGHYGEIASETLLEAADEAQSRSWQLRLTPHQELWAFDPKTLRDSKSQAYDKQSSPSSILHPLSVPSGSVTACAGLRYCPLSLWDIKKDLDLLPLERMRTLGVSLGFSGCLKGCGRHVHSDLGLIGLRTNLYAETERAARVYLGALQAPDPAPARLLYYSVPLRSLDDLLRVILDDFEASGLESFESFSRNVLARYSIEFLQLWYLLRQLYPLGPESKRRFFAGEEAGLLEEFRTLEAYPGTDELYEIVRRLSHRLWDLSAETSPPHPE